MSTVIAPFATATDNLVEHSGWVVQDTAGGSPLPVDLLHWDYQTTLTLNATISVERDALLGHCELGPDTTLAVLVEARSDRTNAHGAVARIEVPAQSRYDLAIDIKLPGHTLGGRLDLVTYLVAVHPQPLNPLGARRPGSVLWRVAQRTHLEGTGARFPTDAADFRQTRPQQSRAGWLLHIDETDPDASFMSSVRLTLNTGHARVRKLLEGNSEPDVRLLLRTMRWDVTRQLVQRALRWDEIDDGPADHDSTTLSGVLRSLLARIWPLEAPSVLRKQWSDSPELLEAQIQHHVELLAD